MSKREDRFDHPLFNPLELIIETMEINRLQSKVNQWLWTGATGGLIQGGSRTGKTTALQLISNRLKSRGKALIPTHFFSVPSRDRTTIQSVFRNMCLSANLQIKRQDTSDALSERFMQYLLDAALDSNSKKIVLFVDEMQRLSLPQFDAFAELYDNMRSYKIPLTVIFTGNDQESSRLLDLISDPGKSHIRGRFFRQSYNFLGITSEKATKFCLKQYDSIRYPVKTGPTYTEYFLSKDFSKGWRLELISGQIWTGFREYQKSLGIKSWGMQYFLSAVNTLITDYLPRYGVKGDIRGMIDESIQVSGLVANLVRKA